MNKENETLEETTQILNVDKIFVNPEAENKMILLSKALMENKSFVMVKIGIKTLIGIKAEKSVLDTMYKFREEAAAFAFNNSMDIDILETYKDDDFSYDAKLIIKRKKAI